MLCTTAVLYGRKFSKFVTNVSCAFARPTLTSQNNCFRLVLTEYWYWVSLQSVHVFFKISFCLSLIPRNIILLQYCESLLYTPLYCQDTSSKTIYSISSMKNAVQRHCVWIIHVQHCKLSLNIHRGQLNLKQAVLSKPPSTGWQSTIWQPTVDKHVSTNF
jgi:hypothetical protein